jgi:inorganic triphosphatase YgiF
MGIESEIKFTVPDKKLFSEICFLKEINGYRIIDKGVKHITDINFDTRDNLLFRSKVVFRLRVMEHKSLLTFKAQDEAEDRSPEGLVYRRVEIESETKSTVNDIISGNLPDIPPVKGLYDKFGTISLVPSLTTKNKRHTLLLTYNNTPHYELALDDVTFCGVRGKMKVYELEIESLFDTDNDLETLGIWFQKQFGLKQAGPSKYILGMELVGNV